MFDDPFVFFALMIAIAVAVRTSGGSVFYRQLRVGHDGRAFVMLKFRDRNSDGGTSGFFRFSIMIGKMTVATPPITRATNASIPSRKGENHRPS